MKRIRPKAYRVTPFDFNDLLEVTSDPVVRRRASNHLKVRLAQAFKLIRLYDTGRLPVRLMRALDEMKVDMKVNLNG